MQTVIPQVSLQQLHIDHEMWLNEMIFFKEELGIFDKYLLEIVRKNTGQDIMKAIEHFQNQFIRQKEVIDELTHDIREHERIVVGQVKELNPIQVEKKRFDDHQELRDYIFTFKKVYAELKQAFLSFVSRTL